MANFYWISPTPANFSGVTNWSSSSGGSPDKINPPLYSDSIFFDGLGVGNCLLNVPATVDEMTIQAGYTGAIYQTNPLIVNSDASFLGGSFVGADASMIVYGGFYEASDFTSTTDLFSIYGNFVSDGTSFHHNDGTCRIVTTNTLFDPNGAHFNQLVFDNEDDPPGYRFIDSTSVADDLTLTGGYLERGSDGTVSILGDIYCNAAFGSWNNNHNAVIRVADAGVQYIYANGGILPYLMIDKTTSSQVRLMGSGPLYINSDFIVEDGTVNTSGVDVQVGYFSV